MMSLTDNPNLPRITEFFAAARALFPHCLVQQPPINSTAIARFFGEIGQPIADARSRGVFLNPWSMVRVDRLEVINSAVLTQFWDPRRSGSRAAAFLNAFFRRIERGRDCHLPSKSELDMGYAITAEANPMAELSDRLDILIETKTQIVGIEIKIDAGEGVEQLARYRAALGRLAAISPGKQGWSLIYLTRTGADPGEVVPASWRDISVSARHIAPVKAAEREFSDWLILAFADHVSTFQTTS
ncbi:PD-(D/E)XK nuclease family protein [Sphingopyxis sp. USTB-05]|uniref:PD-(D/E)XK nuclease family protein n=1 Tax=Sphingopyxis sp. USTB-05 TaxID=2830667 RepID=UPI002078928C|nr:PD-(D/E)XK nuclease family protein [Sphingopyxis sp. USTB-05]USI79077.1 PD-(D/E)XK nuclease family protein [Sphingopyxis sp. USTB-05]